MTSLHFYRGKGFMAWLVRTVSRKPWAHVELVIDGVAFVLMPGVDCYCAGVYSRPVPDARVYLDPVEGAWLRAMEAVGQPYDYIGAVRAGTPFGREHPTRWFCSELAAYALGIPGAHTRSPGDLAELFLSAKT